MQLLSYADDLMLITGINRTEFNLISYYISNISKNIQKLELNLNEEKTQTLLVSEKRDKLII